MRAAFLTTMAIAVLLAGAATTGFHGPARAQKLPEAAGSNLNSSKSNLYRQSQGTPAAGTMKALPRTEIARAACEAKCRQDHQGNPAALEACKRRCGGAEASGARQTWTCYEVCEFQCDNEQPCTRLCMKEC